MTVNIDLIIPGLFDIPADELDLSFIKQGLPTLNQMLRFARPSISQAYDLESMLIQIMGWSGLKTLPFAQAFANPDALYSDKILLFRAVHLKVDMHNAFILPIENNRNNNSNISNIIKDLSELFKVECDIDEIQNGLYIMHLKQCTPMQHYPHYLSVIGKKADPFIEQSRQALPWYKLMNEMQMFMHQHETNSGRLESGLLAINSLWFWGAGDLSKINKTDIQWYCDDILLSRFAGVSGVDCLNLDDVKSADFNHDNVIINMAILEALKSPTNVDLPGLLVEMEKKIFRPLAEAIRSGKGRLRLRTGSNNDLILSRYSFWQYWKKSKSLVEFIEHNE